MVESYIVLTAVGLVAFILSVLHHYSRSWLKIPANDPAPKPRWLNLVFFDLLFYSLIPGVLLVFLYPIFPFSGFKAGLALAVLTFLLGAFPAHLFLVFRHERRFALVSHDLFFTAVKMVLCFGSLGAFYPV